MTPSAAAAVFAIAVFAVVVGFLVVTTYNAIVADKLRIAKAWANIDVALKQRYDQLPNLVEAVRGVMEFEQDTLERVAELRAAYSDRDPIPRQAATSEATSEAVRSLFAVVESYPELRSAENVQRAPGGDQAARGCHRRPARALQRPGLPLQHEDRAGAHEAGGRAVRLDAGRVLHGGRPGADETGGGAGHGLTGRIGYGQASVTGQRGLRHGPFGRRD